MSINIELFYTRAAQYEANHKSQQKLETTIEQPIEYDIHKSQKTSAIDSRQQLGLYSGNHSDVNSNYGLYCMFTTNTTNITQIQLNYKMLQLDNYVATLLQLGHTQLPYNSVTTLCHIANCLFVKGGHLSPPELQLCNNGDKSVTYLMNANTDPERMHQFG